MKEGKKVPIRFQNIFSIVFFFLPSPSIVTKKNIQADRKGGCAQTQCREEGERVRFLWGTATPHTCFTSHLLSAFCFFLSLPRH